MLIQYFIDFILSILNFILNLLPTLSETQQTQYAVSIQYMFDSLDNASFFFPSNALFMFLQSVVVIEFALVMVNVTSWAISVLTGGTVSKDTLRPVEKT